MDRGQPAVLALAFGVWVEATLGEVNVDVCRAVLLHTLYKQTEADYQQIMPKKKLYSWILTVPLNKYITKSMLLLTKPCMSHL